MKKIPMRRCLVSNQMYPKNDLLRIVKTPEGKVVIDLTGKVNGHGAYLCRSKEVFALAKRKRLLDKAFNCQVDESLYDELESLL
jgi:hypothetical protein